MKKALEVTYLVLMSVGAAVAKAESRPTAKKTLLNFIFLVCPRRSTFVVVSTLSFVRACSLYGCKLDGVDVIDTPRFQMMECS